MERIFKKWRSGLAMLLALCLLFSACPVTAFAASMGSNPVKYVSVGDSMTNGYGFVGYNQDRHTSGYDFFAGEGVYGNGAYPLQFEKHLAELNKDRGVEHTKLALSSLRTENLRYLLGITDTKPADGYNGYHGYAGNPSEAQLRAYYQTAMAEADVISLAMGNASFNDFLVTRAMKVLGAMGEGFSDSEPRMTLDDALAMMEGDTEKALVKTAYSTLMSELTKDIPADMLSTFKITELCDLVAYVTASFTLSYKEVIKWIGENNGDAEVILVGIMNSNAGMTISGPGFNFDLGAAMDKVYAGINAYISTMPVLLQATGKCQSMKFYYAAQPSNPEMIATMVDELAASDWGVVDRVDGPVVLKKTEDAYHGTIAPLINPMLADVPAEYHSMVHGIIYAGLKVAIVESLKSGELDIEAIETFTSADGLATLFAKAPVDKIMAIMSGTETVESATAAFAEFFCSDEMLPLVRFFAMNKVGNGISAHPTPATHDRVAASVIAAYGNHTAQDETMKNMEHVLGELKGFLDKLDPETTAALLDKVNLGNAIRANLKLDEKSVYVALGDGSAEKNGYPELLGKNLVSEYGIKNVYNYAAAGNTVGAELESVATRKGIADASLITIGFGNVTMLHNALRNAGKVEYSWTELVGEKMLPFVQDTLSSVSATIADMGLSEAWTTRLNSVVEGFAYSAVEYALKLPELVEEIRTVNDEAVIAVVGQYNPMAGVVLDMGGATLDMSEYIDSLVDAATAHGIGYAAISGEFIFVEAPAVEISNTSNVWTAEDLVFVMLLNGFKDLYPSANGDQYIADRILNALKINQVEFTNPFVDVAESAYYYDAVLWAVEKGITTGTGDGTTFKPDDGCTRAQIATFLWRAAGSPAPASTKMPFKDVASNAYYATAVAWAAEQGITTGTGDGTTFEPNATCTRGQIVTMLARYLKGTPAGGNNPFTDVHANAYYTNAVLWAVQNGITTGTGNGTTFEPNATCTRGQIVTFLFRALAK